jgi:hypothetical protein
VTGAASLKCPSTTEASVIDPAFGDVAESAWEADHGARAPYARFRRSAEQIDAESDRGDDGVVGSTSGTV